MVRTSQHEAFSQPQRPLTPPGLSQVLPTKRSQSRRLGDFQSTYMAYTCGSQYCAMLGGRDLVSQLPVDVICCSCSATAWSKWTVRLLLRCFARVSTICLVVHFALKSKSINLPATLVHCPKPIHVAIAQDFTD